MPSSKNPKIQIVDQDGDHVADSDGRLKVDIAGATISTGDIDVNLDAGTDNVLIKGSDDSGTTKRVIATDAEGHLQVDVVTGGGGSGTEYTEGDTDASITGSAIMWEDTSETLRPVSASKPLPVGGSIGVNVITGYATEETLGDIADCVGEFDEPIGLFGIKTMGATETVANGVPFPMVGADFDAANFRCSLGGVQFVNLVTEVGMHSAIEYDGSLQQPSPGIVNVGAEYRDTPTTYTNGKATILQSDTNGNLKTVKGKYSTVVTNGSVTIGTDSTEILDALAARKYFIIVNDSDTTVYISLGGDAVVGSGIRLNANGGSYTDDMWTGTVSGRSAGSGKNVTVTEV